MYHELSECNLFRHQDGSGFSLYMRVYAYSFEAGGSLRPCIQLGDLLSRYDSQCCICIVDRACLAVVYCVAKYCPLHHAAILTVSRLQGQLMQVKRTTLQTSPKT